MRVALQLWGEMPDLAVSEALHVARLHGPSTVEITHVRSTVLETPAPPEALAARLAMSWGAGHLVADAEPTAEGVRDAAKAIELGDSSFAVRCKRLDRTLPSARNGEVTRALAKALADRGHPVDLAAPDVPVRILLDRRALVAAPWHAIDQVAFEARHVKHRSFFYPITLHPRLARILVNLAQVRRGGTMWDPFTGTGGITLEGALVGADVVASDLHQKMVDGTRATMHQAGVAPVWAAAADVEAAADRLIDEGVKVDVVVTDPPYGKGATLNNEDRDGLYRRFFQAAALVLEPGATLVAMFPTSEVHALTQGAFTLDEMHVVPVHGSMTRHVCRFTRA